MSKLVHACGSSDFELLRTMTMSRSYRFGGDGSVSAETPWDRAPRGVDIAEVRCLGCGQTLPSGSYLLAEVIKHAYATIKTDPQLN